MRAFRAPSFDIICKQAFHTLYENIQFNNDIFNALLLLKNTQNIQPILSKQFTLTLFFPKTSNKTRNTSIQYYFGVSFYRDKCRSDTTSNQRNGVGPAQKGVIRVIQI